MNKATLVAAAALAAFAAPSAAIAAPAPQTGVIQQADVTVESTNEFAMQYRPEANDRVVCAAKISGNEENYTFSFNIPGHLAGRSVTIYIENSDGTGVTLMRTVPDPHPVYGFSTIDIKQPVHGSMLLTAVVDMWGLNARPNGGLAQAASPLTAKQLYDIFAQSHTRCLASVSDGGVRAEIVSDELREYNGTTTIEPVPIQDGDYVEYPRNYAAPENGGFHLGSYSFAFQEMHEEESGAPAATGFKFQIDKKYAGMKVSAYIGGSTLNAEKLNWREAFHKTTVSTDGTFVIPYGEIAGDYEAGIFSFKTLTDSLELEGKCEGVIAINLEPVDLFENGTSVDFCGLAPTVSTRENAEITLANSDLDLIVGSFDELTPSFIGDYTGELVGGFTLQASAFGNRNTGTVTYEVDLGKNYANRIVSIYMTDDYIGLVLEIRTYRTNELGRFTATDRFVDMKEVPGYDNYYKGSYRRYFGIVVEPVNTVSIANATVSQVPDQTWSGTPVTPKPTVTLDGKILAEGTDYELTYENNDKPGTAAVVITGKGTYSGTVRVEFQIAEKGSEPSGPSHPTDPDTPDTPDDPDKPAPTFPDVTKDAWYFEAVTRAAELGVMNGYSGSDRFGPLDWLTREQAAAVMFNYLGDNNLAAPPAPQKDVLNDWYTDAVNWAVAEDVMGGYAGTDLFGIGQTLTREEFCAVIANAAGADLDKVDTSVLDRFADGAAVSAWARPAVAWAVEAGIMNGVELDDGSRALQATRGLVRAEMAAMTVSAIDAGVLG